VAGPSTLSSQETDLDPALVRGYRSIIHWVMNNEGIGVHPLPQQSGPKALLMTARTVTVQGTASLDATGMAGK
jgi:hypothetical protein